MDLVARNMYHRKNRREVTMAQARAAALSAAITEPPAAAPPAVAQLLFGVPEPPPFPAGNIFPLEWHTETTKLAEIYESGRDPGWSPARLPWDTLDPAALTLDQRYAIA